MRALSVADFYRARNWERVDLPTHREAGYTALSMAAHIAHAGVVADLLERGCNLRDQGPGDWTALHAAVHNGHPAIVEQLIAAGSDVNQPAQQGMTPLIQACILQASLPMLKVLLAAPTLEAQRQDAFGCTAEHSLVQTQNHAGQALLLEHLRR